MHVMITMNIDKSIDWKAGTKFDIRDEVVLFDPSNFDEYYDENVNIMSVCLNV